MAIRFRVTDPTRGSIERMRLLMRRKAAWMMGGIVTGIAVLMTVVKVFIAEPIQPEFVIYDPPEENNSDNEYKPTKDISGGTPPILPPMPAIVVSATDAVTDTNFTLDMDVTDVLNIGEESDMDGDGDGLGPGIGSGSAKGGMGGGQKLESGFAGVFYDFKKKPDGKPSALAGPNAMFNGDVLQLESRFVNKMWDLSIFAPYFRPKMQLYASCFYMPNSLDEEACNAYDPEGRYKMKPGRWAAVYRAKVKAPITGRFRFVGVADSVMAVRFDGKNVLFCGLHNLQNAGWNEFVLAANPNALKNREVFSFSNCGPWNEAMGGFVAGSEFSVKEGQWYDMQVLVSEIGGGDFGFCLLIDDMNQQTKKRTKTGQPLFQLFRTAFSAPTAEEAYAAVKFKDKNYKSPEVYTDPAYDEDSNVWEAKPMGPEVKLK